MQIKNIALIVILTSASLLFSSQNAEARIPRSSAAVKEFKRGNPCPVTGATRGKCAGYQVDHIIPLCAGGPDTPANMQWLSIPAHRQKTKVDVMRCRLGKSRKNHDQP